MEWQFDKIEKEAQAELEAVNGQGGLEAFRIKYLGRKGIVQEIFSSLGSVSAEEKPRVGKQANDLRNKLASILEEKTLQLRAETSKETQYTLDHSLPGVAPSIGHAHILSQTIDEICSLFEKLGFTVQDGPEIETEFNNFTALNIPIDHPSRDSFDTFYLEAEDRSNKGRYLLLRSHTSPGQVRILKQFPPPLAVIIPGKVYRPDAVDASHSFMFHQIEGLLVDRDVKFSDLKGLLTVFCQRLFGKDIKMRFRPHFFPFTEPSAEVDISCYICKGKGCSVCGRKGWLEIMGSGMVHPKVFEAAGYPKGKYTGLAFGLGVERITMLKYGINDIRIFFENDKRFLEQF
ncbi:MAG: phenylalanine--tRNA ligase subunit alpha [Candidatus Omnitrophica bacterium]|nr:phenylalanine--tRNA ligase subunit alpha [Candidatus Omnitrophota bacterium]